MTDTPPLSDRESCVLSTIIDEFVHTAQPVGSRRVAKSSRLRLSPATIRNIMADLSDKGMLEQPHTSAGRVPSTLAFRHYVDTMLTLRPLADTDKASLEQAARPDDGDITDVLRKMTQLLSILSGQVCLMLAPNRAVSSWRRMDLVLVRPGSVLAILLLEGGLIHNKLISVDPAITSDDLSTYANYRNDLFKGRSLGEVRIHLQRELDHARREFNQLYARALHLARETCEGEPGQEVYVEGASQVLEQPDFADISSLRMLLRIIEDRARLLELLDKATSQQGVGVRLGRENGLEDLPGFGLVASSYSMDHTPYGAVGIIGPIRMDYARMVPVVGYAAGLISSLLHSRR